jgi:hypothetical protein
MTPEASKLMRPQLVLFRLLFAPLSGIRKVVVVHTKFGVADEIYCRKSLDMGKCGEINETKTPLPRTAGAAFPIQAMNSERNTKGKCGQALGVLIDLTSSAVSLGRYILGIYTGG